MPYNQELEAHINEVWLAEFPEEAPLMGVKKMFGGLAYLYEGKMTVGIVGEELMVRVLPAHMEEVLRENTVRPMDFTGRPMREFVFVEPDGFSGPGQLARWIRLGLEHAKKQLSNNRTQGS